MKLVAALEGYLVCFFPAATVEDSLLKVLSGAVTPNLSPV